MNRCNWKVAIAGEAMVTRPFAMHDDPAFLEMIKLLRDADVTYAHLEGNLGHIEEIEWAARGEHSGSYFMSDPQIADDLKWAGIDIVSNAHNHSGDFGASGVLATRRHCKRAGLACAGTGKDLEEARGPAYAETRKGRVALVSMTSGNRREDWASLPKGGTRGRPGVNPLRATVKYVVDHQTAEQVKELGRKLKVLRDKVNLTGDAAVAMKTEMLDGHGFEEGEFGLGKHNTGGGSVFIEGDHFEVITTVHEKDLMRNCRSVDEAMQMADLVIVGHHCNLAEAVRGDIYVGHGWHKTLGIEIYKNKPIFYGIGNFFAQNEFVQNVPYDSYESWGHDMDHLPTFNSAIYPLHPGGPESTEIWWSSAIAIIEMEGHKMTGMKLYPVEMGRDVLPEVSITRATGSGPDIRTEGRPIMADKENGLRILERIQRLSAEYGTKVEIKDGVGIIEIK
jgi:hypothetical protein